MNAEDLDYKANYFFLSTENVKFVNEVEQVCDLYARMG